MAVSIRKLKRAWTVYKDEGLSEIFSRILRRLGFSDPEHSEWLRLKAEKDAQFDRRLGTDTGGIQDIQVHPILGENAKHGGSHIASDPSDFEAMMAAARLGRFRLRVRRSGLWQGAGPHTGGALSVRKSDRR